MKKSIESEICELKSSLSEMNDVIETISAFSNVKGGEILVGINPGGKVVGVSIGKNTIENLASDIKRNTDPSIFPNINVEKFEANQLSELP